MAEAEDEILDQITAVVPRLLGLLDALAWISRHIHPPRLPALLERLDNHDADLRASLDGFRAATWPEGFAPFRDQLAHAADLALRACDGLRAAAISADSRFGAYRALRDHTRATEALYPLAAALPTIGRWFLDPSRRDDDALLASLRNAAPDTGVMHANNETRTRGGFSVYVPENYSPTRPWPVVMALHGGAGHGRLFLWTWLREARSRGLILVAPTATGDTWSLMEPEVDTAHLAGILADLRARYNVDPARLLLTGMSDGGTFTLLSGLDADSPFTHLAPVAASFHPMLLTMSDPARTAGLPVYLVHGALDWMFPVSVGRTASRALAAAGARVTYREIEDLSHTYPREENERIIDWLLADTPGT
jgi:phospholipase/carboxylesterase